MSFGIIKRTTTLKHVLIALLLMVSSSRSFAQADLEAKAAYLLAEESYGKGEMKATLEYLAEASSKLGNSNAKILYLKIMAERELANKDKKYLTQLNESITLFEKSPDAGSFNEEKALEIMKIKIGLKKELDALQKEKEQAAKALELQVLAGPAIKKFEDEHPNWPIGASLQTLREKNPVIFKELDKKVNKPYIISTPPTTSYIVPNATSGIMMFTVDGSNRLSQFSETLFDFKNDDRSFTKGKAAFDKLLEDLKQKFGYLPEPSRTENPQYGGYAISYTWQTKEKILVLSGSFFWMDVTNSGYSSSLIQIMSMQQ